ncbi:MAG: hypothetical protein OEV40_30010 [Acidimicrobiia bacterium]|nr:hypothetical protein [Acidimicrobiia bacterium]
MRTRRRLAVALAAATLALISCGSSENGASESQEADADGTAPASESGFDESVLPDDFPTNLIPPAYDTGAYLDVPGTQTASFESSRPVDESIDHYTDLLGEPTVAVEGDPGQKNVQWQDSDWIVSVIGSPEESIIGISKLEG